MLVATMKSLDEHLTDKNLYENRAESNRISDAFGYDCHSTLAIHI